MQLQEVLYNRPPVKVQHRTDQKRSSHDLRAIIGLLHPGPAAALRSLIVINCDEQQSSRGYHQAGVFERTPHLASMMKNPPRVDDIKLPEPRKVSPVKRRTLLNSPVVVVWEKTPPEFLCTSYRIRIVV